MKVAIIITTPDFAGLNIKDNLLDSCSFSETGEDYAGYHILKKDDANRVMLYTTDDKCIFLENLHDKIDADLFIMPTIHRSESGKRTLSCHTQGNWDKADLGGVPKNLSIAPAFYLKKAIESLVSVQKEMGLDYEPTLECTHHGPQLEAPTLFIEIGSSEKEWKDKAAGKAIAKVILELLDFNPEDERWKPAIGIGGPHYCNTFNKIMLRTDIAIGHICPKYMVESIDKNMIMQAIEKTQPMPELAMLDWKGLGGCKEKIKLILEDIGIAYEKAEKILKRV